MRFTKFNQALCILLLGFSASASADIVETIAEGCAAEIENYCSQVTPGEGRLLACFFAHEDKLSGKCEFAMYNAAAELEHAVNSLAYVAAQCEKDILANCGDVAVGEGRVLDCLEANQESVSDACKQAVDEVFEKVE
jgi:hypothetical protein